ncbi:hypothetical protein B0H10DRAFT_2193128 [Mycena sp. CBHHK59/15]|nr:hypothetical protein B0H10DRAFT_2193128 [Mycena sp. CBHHK59/15]
MSNRPFCWRLLLAESDPGFQLTARAVTLSFMLSPKRVFSETGRFLFENDDGLVHVFHADNGLTAEELLRTLQRVDPYVVIGARAPAIPPNIFSIAGWQSYHELHNQYLVSVKPFASWNEVTVFQGFTRGWCYLQLVAATPAQAARAVRGNGMTMDWDSIIGQAETYVRRWRTYIGKGAVVPHQSRPDTPQSSISP